MKLTPAREIWLKKLRDEGPSECRHGPTRFACHQAGYTEWVYKDDKTGEIITMDEAREHYPKDTWDNVTSAGERITEAGLEVLNTSK